MCVCLSVCHKAWQSICQPRTYPPNPASMSNRGQTEAEGAEWVPGRFGYNNKICAVHLASPSLLFLLVSQEIQCSAGRLNAFEVLEEMDC